MLGGDDDETDFRTCPVLAAVSGVALSTGAASAMPIGTPVQASNIEKAAWSATAGDVAMVAELA